MQDRDEEDRAADCDEPRPAPPERRYHAECALCRGMPRRGGHSSAMDHDEGHESAVGHEGANVPGWGVWICSSCRQRNHDGIAPQSHREFVEMLRARGVPIELNAMGWIAIPD